MNRNLMILFLVAGCLFTCGCGDKHDKYSRDSIAQLKKLVSVLEGINSVEDARSARSEVEQIVNNLKTIETNMRKLKKPNPQQDQNLKSKYEKDAKELGPKLVKLMNDFSPEIRQELKGALKEVANGS